jgi:uncharacterized membrane protein YraQ (UPF0718 family)
MIDQEQMKARGSGRGPGRGQTSFLGAGIVLLALAAFVLLASRLSDFFDTERVSAFATVFVSIVVQAMPFLVLGVLLSGAIVAFVPKDLTTRILPRNRYLSVPVAGAAGLALPGCECASVPVAGGMIRKGVPPAAALTFLLAAPAINPIVLVATWVAFPNDPMIVVARFVASLAAAIGIGWLWVALGRTEWLQLPRRSHLESDRPWTTFRRSTAHDFLHAGGYLVLGGLIAAVINVLLPPAWVDSLAGQAVIGVLVLTLLAILMCICSEADAFVAASFTQFSRTAQLAFMVVGPMVDLKLVAMQVGTFGRGFAIRFAPNVLVVAVAASVIVGWVLL